jgi:hypothetical protein
MNTIFTPVTNIGIDAEGSKAISSSLTNEYMVFRPDNFRIGALARSRGAASLGKTPPSLRV